MEFIKNFLVALLLFAANFAQAEVTESRDLFYRSGMFNVVVAVLLILFIFLFVYLFRLDRKVSNIEKNTSEK